MLASTPTFPFRQAAQTLRAVADDSELSWPLLSLSADKLRRTAPAGRSRRVDHAQSNYISDSRDRGQLQPCACGRAIQAPWQPHPSQRPTARAVRASPAAYQSADAAPLPPVNARANAPTAPEPVPPGAQAPLQSLTLDDLQSMALANNPTLAQAAARVQAARGRWVQAGLHPNPRIGYMADDIGAMDTAGKQGAAFSQEIVRGGKLGLDRAVASREIAQAQQQLEVQRWRVTNDVRAQFYSLLVAQRTMELSDQLTELGRRSLKSAEDLFRGMLVSRVDVLQAQIELSTVQATAEGARHRYAAAWRRLAATVGVPDMQPVPVSGDLQPSMDRLTWEESLQRILGSSPELGAAFAGVERTDLRWLAHAPSRSQTSILRLPFSTTTKAATMWPA